MNSIHLFLLLANFPLLLLGLLSHFKSSPAKSLHGLFFVLLLMDIGLLVLFVISDIFTDEGITDATIYQIQYGLQGTGFLEYAGIIVAAVLIVLTVFFLFYKVMQRQAEGATFSALKCLAAFAFMLLAIVFNPSVYDIYTLKVFSGNTERDINKSDFNNFYQSYHKPSVDRQDATSVNNLVFIYVESLERTYFDESLFPGLIKNLKAIESKAISFTNISQVPGAGWTIAGLTASQCGIALVAPLNGGSMSGMNDFLPSANCLGDLLKREGYELSYFGGADLEFAGKGKFLKTHGFANVFGKRELAKALEDKSYTNGWGLYDDSLFDFIFAEYERLSSKQKPFALFGLTLDTHPPRGHVSKSCQGLEYQKGDNPILNAVACTDYLIGRLINDIQASELYNDTVIVIASDHLALNNTSYEQLKKGDRSNLFLIIPPNDGKPFNSVSKSGTTLDIGATILPFLGLEGRLGLGRDLLNESSSNESVNNIQQSIRSWKNIFASFWRLPELTKGISFDARKETVSISEKVFKLPVLIELNEHSNTVLNIKTDVNIRQSLLDINNSHYFIMLDKCLNTATNAIAKFCISFGQGSNFFNTFKLSNDKHFSLSDIKRELGLENHFNPMKVARAGGAIKGQVYTNSIDALDANYAKGFRYFEIDLSFSSDDKLVCLDDWERDFKQAFGFVAKEGAVSYDEFNRLVEISEKFQKCNMETLAQWFESKPDAFLISDFKTNNLQGLELLSQFIANFEKHVIPQIYSPESFSKVKEMGFKQVIWSLSRYEGSRDDVLRWAQGFSGNYAVTMSEELADTRLPRDLQALGVPSYVQTINAPHAEAFYTRFRGISNVYTDFLMPRE